MFTPTASTFLAAIAAMPDDDTTRLVFADWLEEQGDPLAEFIRLQIELEPLRVPRVDPVAEFERVRLLRNIAPGSDFRKDDTPLARKLDRERELLCQHQARWLGPLSALEQDHASHFEPEFRRGLVESAGIGLSALLEHGPALRQACPTLQHLIVFGTLGRCESLAAQPALAGLPRLTLAGWLDPADAGLLARSPHLKGLRSLTYWISPYDEAEACLALARLPGLHELTLVQMLGGQEADGSEALDRAADQLADRINRALGKRLARVSRPFARRFPLDGVYIGHGVDAGHLPGGRPVLVDEGRQPVLIHFDDNGYFLREEQLDLRGLLVEPPEYSWEDCNAEELIKVLGREVGFEPGPIFVREFWSQLADVGLTWCGVHEEMLHEPDSVSDPEEAEEICASLHWWESTGQFALPFGNCYWADGTGRIHTS